MKPESLSPCLKQPGSCPILSQIIPFHAFLSYVFKIHFSIFPPRLMSLKCSLSFMISHQTPSTFLTSPYMSDARPILNPRALITLTILGEVYKNHEQVPYLSFTHLLLPPFKAQIASLVLLLIHPVSFP
jgi:hypothetical protein